MNTLDKKVISKTLDEFFKMRRSIVLKDEMSEEEVDTFIVEESRKAKEKWENVDQDEMLLMMLSDIATRISKDPGAIEEIKKARESFEDDEPSL